MCTEGVVALCTGANSLKSDEAPELIYSMRSYATQFFACQNVWSHKLHVFLSLRNGFPNRGLAEAETRLIMLKAKYMRVWP